MGQQQKSRLENINLDEVSFLERGDDPLAKVMFFKREQGAANITNQIVKVDKGEDGVAYITDGEDNYYLVTDAEVEKDDDGNYIVTGDSEYIGKADGSVVPELPAEKPGFSAGTFLEMAKKFFGSEKFEKSRFDDVLRARNAEALAGEVFKLFDIYESTIYHAIYSPNPDIDVKAELRGNTESFLSEIEGAVGRWESGELRKAGAKISSARLKAIKEAKARLDDIIQETEGEPTNKNNKEGEQVADVIDKSGLSDEQRVAVEKIEYDNLVFSKRAENLVPDLDGSSVHKTDSNGEYVFKKDKQEPAPEPTDLEKRYPFLKGQSEEVLKQYDAQQQKLEKLQRDSEEREYIEKASAYGNLPVSPQELGPVLRRIDKGESGSDDLKYLQDVFGSTQEMAKSNALFAAQGGTSIFTKSGGGTDIEAEMDSKADEISKRDSITKEAAYGKIKKEAPELAKRYNEREDS